MPTVCELQVEAKKLGLKGYSKMRKAQLETMVNKAKSPAMRTRSRAPLHPARRESRIGGIDWARHMQPKRRFYL